MAEGRCESTLYFVPNEDFRECQKPLGHDGRHLCEERSEWTDQDARDSLLRWGIDPDE